MTSQVRNKARSPLLRLPSELQNKIFVLRIPTEPIIAGFVWQHHPIYRFQASTFVKYPIAGYLLLSPLSLASSQLYEEVAALSVSNVVFRILFQKIHRFEERAPSLLRRELRIVQVEAPSQFWDVSGMEVLKKFSRLKKVIIILTGPHESLPLVEESAKGAMTGYDGVEVVVLKNSL
ncbi:hypothetical protein EK21DRAFT_108191 [Setomelanomma holmii]|uniref:Uncharacterized protein n=1 Tax=Setomelanomma holmii TaxID=210430 RepID=A0A9P4HGH9_9PLEO|nr:hypothetical protein EK21DRAFT_108191 [Setomelanomma holmii]